MILFRGCLQLGANSPLATDSSAMKLENIKVAARLRESPAALFKVNKISLSEDEKSIVISNLNGIFRVWDLALIYYLLH